MPTQSSGPEEKQLPRKRLRRLDEKHKDISVKDTLVDQETTTTKKDQEHTKEENEEAQKALCEEEE